MVLPERGNSVENTAPNLGGDLDYGALVDRMAEPVPAAGDVERPVEVRSLPLAFGIRTRLMGSGRQVSFLEASASSPSQRYSPDALAV